MRIAEQGLYKEFYDYFTDDAIQRVGTGAAEDIIPFFGVVRGRDAMLDSMAIGKDTQFEPIDWRLDCYYAAEDRVFATGSASYRFRATGEEFSTDQTYELVFDNGQCKELIRSVDTAAFYKRQRDYLDSASACWLLYVLPKTGPHMLTRGEEYVARDIAASARPGGAGPAGERVGSVAGTAFSNEKVSLNRPTSH